VQQYGRLWKDIQQKYLPARSRLDLSNRFETPHPLGITSAKKWLGLPFLTAKFEEA
jgi:hypothetical protein